MLVAPDKTPPTISLSVDLLRLRQNQTAKILFELSEASSDFTLDDLSCSGGTLSGFTGNGTSYSVVFTPTTNSIADGIVSVASNKFSDAAGNFNVDGTDVDNSITISINTLANAPVALSLKIYDWKTHSLLPNAAVSIDSNIGQTGSNRSFYFDGLSQGVHNLSATFASSAVSERAAISLKDALAALKLAIGIDAINSSSTGASVSASPYQRVAADFNADGKVDLKDALEILKYSIGVATTSSPKWQFYDEAEVIAKGAKPATDFSQTGRTVSITADRSMSLVGVLTGDVDGSWAPPSGSTIVDSQHFTALVSSLQTADPDVSLARWGIYG
jgi:hypothetical protein